MQLNLLDASVVATKIMRNAPPLLPTRKSMIDVVAVGFHFSTSTHIANTHCVRQKKNQQLKSEIVRKTEISACQKNLKL
jgi:hypothetical protein